MNISQDVKQYGETAVEQGKAVVAEARKPLYALVGAGELAVERVRDLAVRVRQTDPDIVRDQLGKYLQEAGAQALTVYSGLTQRGERVLNELRHQPVVQRVLVGAEEAVDKVEDALEDLIAGRGTKADSPERAADAEVVDTELVDEEPAEEKPADEKPTDEKPTDEKPAARASSRSGRKPTPKK